MSRQHILLLVNKYLAYLINIVIIAALLAGVGYFVYGLYLFAISP
jgi:hypothetical protein